MAEQWSGWGLLIMAIPFWLQQMVDVFNSYGVPVTTWAPIVQVESSFNPTIVNPNTGDATGILQITRQHVGNTPDWRTDPVASARWAAPRMADAIRRMGASDPLTVGLNSDWPGNVGVNSTDPEAIRWRERYRTVVPQAISDPGSMLNQLYDYALEGNTEPSPYPPAIQPPYTPPPPQNITPPLEAITPRQGAKNTSIAQLQPIQVGPFKIDPNPIVAITGRFAFSAVALGAILIGAIFLLWNAIPQDTKDTAVEAAKHAI